MTPARALRCSAVLFLSAAASAQSNTSSNQPIVPANQSIVSSSRSAPAATRFIAPSEGPKLVGPYLKGGGSFQPSLGYRPGLAFGGGLDHRFSRLLLLSDVSMDTSNKVGVPSGLSFRVGASAYAMKKHMGLGGGARCGKLKTSVYDKGSCRPFIGGVYSSPVFRFDAAYIFPGTDKVNRLQGIRTITLLPVSKHMAFEMEFGLYRFNASFGTKMHTGISTNPGMRYIF